MITVELDDRTAERLHSLAAASGLAPTEFLQLLLSAVNSGLPARLTHEQLEGLLNELAFDGPSLPADFSRADIYDEHD